MLDRWLRRDEMRVRGNEFFPLYLTEVQRKSNELGIDTRIVGGIFTDLIGLKTTYRIDPIYKTVDLFNHNPLRLYRPSDNTLKDVDMICFCPDQTRYQEFRAWIKKRSGELEREGIAVAKVSVEPTHYPGWPNRHRNIQMVSTLDVDENGILSLNFGPIHKTISWLSVAPWKVYVESERSITTLNPFAHALRYLMRCPSGAKQKDKEIHTDGQTSYSKTSLLMKLAMETYKTALAGGINYKSERYFKPWIEFIREMQTSQDPSVRVRRQITGIYWDTIGTFLSHMQALASLSDKFSG